MKLGAYALEQDYSHYTANASVVTLALVGTATKGPINVPTVCTSIRDLIGKFGPVSPNSYGMYAGQYFLNQASKLFYVRLAGPTAAKAEANIAALTDSATYPMIKIKDSTGAIDALTLKSKVIGSDYNGMTAEVTVDGDTYEIVIKDVEGAQLERFVGLTNSSVKTLNSKYFEFSALSDDTVALKDGSYIAADGAGEAEEGLVLVSTSEGTYFNSLRIMISDSDLVKKTFSLTVLDKSGGVIYQKKGISAADISSIKTEDFTFKSFSGDAEVPKNGVYEVTGGANGDENIDSSTYINAAETLRSSNYDYTLIAVPGVSDANLISRVLSMLETRGDGFMLVDPPYGLTEQGVVDWHNGSGSYDHMMFNSSYGALYYDWQTIYDTVNSQYVVVPPSVVVAATYAYSARTSEIWYAPAGLTRGLIRGVYNPVSSPDINARDYLYLDNNVNPIVKDPQAGLCIFGQKTLMRANSALNRVNVRMLLNYLKKIISATCQYLTFEPNDRITWTTFEDLVEPTLDSIRHRRGVYEYYLVPGEEVVTPDDIDNYRMPGRIFIKPTKTAEVIPIYFTLTSTGAIFNDVLESISF